MACLDLKRSEVEYYSKEDFDVSPNADEIKKIGTISYIRHLKIDVTKIGEGDHVFRLDEDGFKMIISDAMRIALMNQGISGARFVDVSS